MFDENLKQIIMLNWHIVVARLLRSESRPLVNAVSQGQFFGLSSATKIKVKTTCTRRQKVEKTKNVKEKNILN